MPGPAVAAIAGGLGSAIIGARASSNAANAQKDASRAQIQLQSDMFNRMDELQGDLYKRQEHVIRDSHGRIMEDAIRPAYRNALNAATDYRNEAIRGASGTRNRNMALNENALAMGLDRAGDTRTANISDYRREMGGGTRRINQARDASLGYFEPSIDRGNSAGGAYAYNLGIGGKPSDYTGLKESEGTKYLMRTGRQEIEGGAAGAGNLNSGATLAALEEKRQGLASLDKDNQMSQLMALAGLGQSAANSASGIRTSSANSVNALRGGYTGAIAGERGDYRDRANALQDQYTGRGMNINDTFNANRTGALGDYAGMITSAGNNRAAGVTNAWNNLTSNLGTARANRANLMGTSAMNYANQAGQAYGAMGDAKAAGSIGSANALLGGINNGIGIYGMMGGGFGGGAKTPTVPSSGTNVFASSNPFANWNSWLK